MPPRGKKAQAPEPELSGEEQVVEAPVMSSGSNAIAGEKSAKKGRGKAVAKAEDNAEAMDVASEAPVPKPRSKAVANKKKDVVAAPDPDEDVEEMSEDAKKGRNRGKKTTSGEAGQAGTVSETVDAPKRGKGRGKKETVAVEDRTESSELDSEPITAPMAKATGKPGRGADKQKEAEKESDAVTEKTTGRGKGRKMAEPEEPAVAEEAVLEEKKKRGGRPKKATNDEETNSQAANQQPEDDGTEAEAGPAPPALKKGRSKKTPQKKQGEQMDVALSVEKDDTAEESASPKVDPKKKGGRGRKAANAAAPEVEQADELPILQVPAANIETRKGRGTPRATTPAAPKTPTPMDSTAEEKKGRGRNKKETVATPQRTAAETAEVVEEPKKKGGRAKKVSEKQEDEGVGSSPAIVKERKRKDGATQSQIVKKSQKQK